MKPEKPLSVPAMISTLLPMREAHGGAGEARVGVQQRHDDRHVRGADGQHEHHAEDERQHQHEVEERAPRRDEDEREEAARTAAMSAKLKMFWPLKVIGAPGMRSCSLAKATRLPVVVSAPSSTSKPSAHRETAERRAVLVIFHDADERRGERAESMRERGPLRHARSSAPSRASPPIEPAEQQAGDDPVVADDLVVQQRADDRHQHAELGQVHPAPRRVRMAQPLSP